MAVTVVVSRASPSHKKSCEGLARETNYDGGMSRGAEVARRGMRLILIFDAPSKHYHRCMLLLSLLSIIYNQVVGAYCTDVPDRELGGVSKLLIR